jgi:D-3-phosphoglycerate dehydrogenase
MGGDTAGRMANFKAVLIEHGYSSSEIERGIITAAGGEFIDASDRPLEEALRLCEEAQGVMLRRVEAPVQLLRRFRRCKILVRYGVGTDNVDVDAATAQGIIVGHTPEYGMDEVSTHAIALWLACVRRLVETHSKMAGSSAWDVHRNEPLWRVAGRTLGIVGLGNIGRTVARKMAGWGVRLLAADPFVDAAVAAELEVELVDLDRLCQESDYITLHCPLLPETKHLINSRTLGLMKPGAILVNTARGPVVETEALLKSLDTGRLAMAGLDVFEEEPLPKGSPLRSHPRVVHTDHVAWYSEEAQAQLQRTAAEEVARVCTGGLPRSLANPQVLRRLGRFEEWTPSESVKWQLRRLERLASMKP